MKSKNKSDGNQKWFILGEIFGKAGVWSTKVTIILILLGYICELTWDINERKANNKKH
jgi:hypothetical protein